jgi:hypothetical protein
MREYVQTMKGTLFVAGKSKMCDWPDCTHGGHHYHASRVWQISVPQSTYGLDVLAFIGWQHEQEHKQFAEIQGMLNQLRKPFPRCTVVRAVTFEHQLSY